MPSDKLEPEAPSRESDAPATATTEATPGTPERTVDATASGTSAKPAALPDDADDKTSAKPAALPDDADDKTSAKPAALPDDADADDDPTSASPAALPAEDIGAEPSEAPPSADTTKNEGTTKPAGASKAGPTLQGRLGVLVGAIAARAKKLDQKLVRFDPCTDPEADPLTALSVLALVVATSYSLWLFLRWKYQPMQDLGHHVALAAVVSDYGRPGSLYTSLYEPIDPFAANSLLYQLAGNLGRLVGVSRAIRFFMALYIVGTPLATAFALRVFGRNIWGAVLSVPLSYNMIFVAGFANMLFGAPLMIMAVPLLHLAIVTRSWKRALVAALVIALLFLGHAHLFMWTGFMLFLLTLGHFVYGLTQGPGLKKRALHAVKSAGVAFLCVVPTLLLFARWYARTFGEGRNQGTVMNATAGADAHFGAVFRPPHQMFASLVDVFELTTDDSDVQGILILALLGGLMLAMSRLEKMRKPPVLETISVMTMLSYFVLPDGLSGHDVLTQRQPSIALWFAPAIFTPVSMRTSRILRFISVAGIVALTIFMLDSWHKNLVKFQRDEVAGLDEIMTAAPPRLRIHYVKLDPNSRYFTWRPFWHLEKLYMGDKLGQTPDTPGILSTSSIRYRPGLDIHRIVVHTNDWPNDSEIWKNFELVMVRSWHASPAQRAAAERHGVLLKRAGAWELWRSNEAVPAP